MTTCFTVFSSLNYRFTASDKLNQHCRIFSTYSNLLYFGSSFWAILDRVVCYNRCNVKTTITDRFPIMKRRLWVNTINTQIFSVSTGPVEIYAEFLFQNTIYICEIPESKWSLIANYLIFLNEAHIEYMKTLPFTIKQNKNNRLLCLFRKSINLNCKDCST